MFILLLVSVLFSVFFINRVVFTTMGGKVDSVFTIILSVFLLLLILLVVITKSIVFTAVCIVLSICVVVIDRLFFILRYSVYQLEKDLVIDHCLIGSLLVFLVCREEV